MATCYSKTELTLFNALGIMHNFYFMLIHNIVVNVYKTWNVSI